MLFGQVIIGAPGSGKSTYCDGMQQLLTAGLRRTVACVNLDPANDAVSYPCDVDVRELITVEEVMQRLGLGPNGALLYCMQMLAANSEWLRLKLEKLAKDSYLLIDLPGQLELYCSDDSVAKVVKDLQKWGHRISAVHLSDGLYCGDAGKFVSLLMSSLSAMVNLELPHVNVLSKMDLVDEESLPFALEFFTDVLNMKQLLQLLDNNPILAQYKSLNDAIVQVVHDFDLVSFICLDVRSKEKMRDVLMAADRANGYALLEATDLRNVCLK